jgi:hypothetical protein
MIRWRRHTEKPRAIDSMQVTAIIAFKSDDGTWALVDGIFIWRDGKWVREEDYSQALDRTEFCWLPETELIAELEGGLK